MNIQCCSPPPSSLSPTLSSMATFTTTNNANNDTGNLVDTILHSYTHTHTRTTSDKIKFKLFIIRDAGITYRIKSSLALSHAKVLYDNLVHCKLFSGVKRKYQVARNGEKLQKSLTRFIIACESTRPIFFSVISAAFELSRTVVFKLQ